MSFFKKGKFFYYTLRDGGIKQVSDLPADQVYAWVCEDLSHCNLNGWSDDEIREGLAAAGLIPQNWREVRQEMSAVDKAERHNGQLLDDVFFGHFFFFVNGGRSKAIYNFFVERRESGRNDEKSWLPQASNFVDMRANAVRDRHLKKVLAEKEKRPEWWRARKVGVEINGAKYEVPAEWSTGVSFSEWDAAGRPDEMIK